MFSSTIDFKFIDVTKLYRLRFRYNLLLQESEAIVGVCCSEFSDTSGRSIFHKWNLPLPSRSRIYRALIQGDAKTNTRNKLIFTYL